jgi:hypothetical protein
MHSLLRRHSGARAKARKPASNDPRPKKGTHYFSIPRFSRLWVPGPALRAAPE